MSRNVSSVDVITPEAERFSLLSLGHDAGGVVGLGSCRRAAAPSDDSTEFSFKTLGDSPLYGTRISLDSKMEATEDFTFQTFRECLSTPLIEKSAEQPVKKTRRARGRETAIKAVKREIEEPNDAEELAEFIDVRTSSISHSVS